MIRKIILMTGNKEKVEAYKKHFSIYGIGVEKSKRLNEQECDKLLENENNIAIISDKSNLYNRETGVISKQRDMELVYNRTIMEYQTKKHEKELVSKKIFGFIELTKRDNTTRDDLIWWDDIFVVSNLGKTYKELLLNNMKNSGREELISKFILDEIYYENKIDLNFNPQNQERTIEFNNGIVDFIKNNKLLNTPANKQFRGVFNLVLDNGIFFRSAKNRREKNYWLPGLNAGVPLVPKKDNIHEITFAVHDLCHFVMPDLIYDGISNSKKQRDIYIIYRMMSEAITMVLADMVYVDGLVQDGIDYDFSKRNIYPLYEKIKHNKLSEILYANVIYCIKGDDTFYKELLGNKNLEVLERFKEKYTAFFVEDYKWTIKNYENMKSNNSVFTKWAMNLDDVIEKSGLTRLSKFSRLIDEDNVVDNIFEYVMTNIISPMLEVEDESVREDNVSNAFRKYMLGQMFLFYKFDFVQSTQVYINKISTILRQKDISSLDIVGVRDLYEDFLSQLLYLGLINEDDLETYKEVYPIFDSFFVFYDEKNEYYERLDTIFEREISYK